MSKKEPLRVGQKASELGCDVCYENEPEEMVVFKANKSTAYIWYNNQSKSGYKVDQKTHHVKYCIPDGRTYRLWLSKEEYDQNVIYEKELKKLREKLHNAIDTISLSQLKELNKSLFG